jgi:Tfp pilus assembly protein PilF
MSQATNRKSLIVEMLKNDPSDVFLNYALGIEFISENDLENAIAQMEKVLEKDPEYLACYYQLGKLYEQKSNLERAKTYYTSGLEKAQLKNDLKTHGELSEALMMIDDAE